MSLYAEPRRHSLPQPIPLFGCPTLQTLRASLTLRELSTLQLTQLLSNIQRVRRTPLAVKQIRLRSKVHEFADITPARRGRGAPEARGLRRVRPAVSGEVPAHGLAERRVVVLGVWIRARFGGHGADEGGQGAVGAFAAEDEALGVEEGEGVDAAFEDVLEGPAGEVVEG